MKKLSPCNNKQQLLDLIQNHDIKIDTKYLRRGKRASGTYLKIKAVSLNVTSEITAT